MVQRRLRSCEYLKTSLAEEKRKSQTLRIRNQRFYKKGRILEYSVEPEDIGTHSIRSGAAMAMYLAGVPTFTIMMI